MEKKFPVILSLFLLLICINASIAQTSKTTLKWKNVQKHTFGNDSLKYLYFEGAIFEIDKPGLPFFYNREKINFPHAEIKAKLENMIFEEISPADIAEIKNINSIEDKIKIESFISIQEKQPYSNIKFIPIRKNSISGNYEKLISFDLSVEIIKPNNGPSYESKQNWSDNSVLKEGKWFKIAVNENGIYKITYDQLISMGLNITDPRKIRVYGNGGGMLSEVAGNIKYDDLVENAIYVEGENDGSFDSGDYVLFYGESPNAWYYDISGTKLFFHKINLYTDYNYYFINADIGAGKRISAQNSTSAPSNKTVTDFNDFAFHEMDSENFLSTGKDWFGERFDAVIEYNFPFSFPDIKQNDTAYIKTNVLTHTSAGSNFTYSCTNSNRPPKTINIPGVPASDLYLYGYNVTDSMRFLPNNPNLNVNIKYNKPTSASSAIGFLDYIEISVRRNLNFNGGQLRFRDKNTIGAGNISDFIITNVSPVVKVWEITNPHDIKSQEYTFNGNNLTYRIATDTLREFVAFDGTSFNSPTLIGNVENQNLHNLSNISFIIVTPPVFLTEANRLADFHRTKDNMSVVVATTDQIYNEFSSGKQDIAAIRNFVKMFYDKCTGPEFMPKNLLLFGDASYDYKDRIAENTNFVPTYEAFNSLSLATSWVTDDFFGLLDYNEGYNSTGDLDIGIGRIPVRTIEEAKNAVDKILRYGSKTNLVPNNSSIISNFADWRNIVCFVADDGENDGATFMIDTEQLTSIFDQNHKTLNVDKIYLDAFQQIITPGGPRYPDVNQAINKRVMKGALIVNYVGHSGEVGWSLERILGMTDISSWENMYNMPVFFSASCSFSRFDDPGITSAGESVFLNPNGGGVALYSTTRLAYSGPNFTLSHNFYDTAFTKANNQYYTMGELMKIAKVRSQSNESIRNFVLLGDPALKFANPQYNIVTTQVNDSASSYVDTLMALSKVNIKGFVADDFGNKLTTFNGILYPTVYDKFSLVRTLGNDNPPCAPFDFSVQKNILYKGKVSVKNGDFNFSFMIPKDINYTYGHGKISYYAENGSSDAAGYYDNFIIGGSDTNFIPDNAGPNIELFMNNKAFVFGGLTDENPYLLSFLSDIHGINTVGNGVGHDIIAVLDENNQNPYVLNDYYQADLDSFTRGSILYPFLNLNEGKHNLKLRAWDIYNNSSEAYTEFFVAKSAKIALNDILNYPNPFSDKTTFRFQHNQSDSNLDIFIQIFSISGSLIKTIETNVRTTGYIIDQIDWDGTNEYGQKIGSGIYVYKIKVGNKENGYIEKSQKLVLIK